MLEFFRVLSLAMHYMGGFDWNATSQGFDFWERVIRTEDFAYFFKEYKP